MGPSALSVSATAFRQPSPGSRPAPTPKPAIDSAAFFTSASVLATTATRAPSAASAWAMPKPMPRDAAVTRATLPVSPRSIPGMLAIHRDRPPPPARSHQRRPAGDAAAVGDGAPRPWHQAVGAAADEAA